MRLTVSLTLFISILLLILWLSVLPRHNEPSYPVLIAGLILGIFVILGGCELFANGVECLGDRLNLSHATVGSLFAAVGTALPETIVPVIALVFGSTSHSEGIAVGAILGAPFMISTLAMFLLGLTLLLVFFIKKREKPVLRINSHAFRLELVYFIIVMVGLLLVSYINKSMIKHIYALLLAVSYMVFFRVSLGHESLEDEDYTDRLHLSFFTGCPIRLRWIIGQVLLGLIFIIAGAHVFVEYLTVFSIKTGISSLVLSLLLTPVATELPEKFNSITWTIKGKDTIAIGNLTGAMVFQSTIPVAIGLSFTNWQLEATEYINIASTIVMSLILLFSLKENGRLPFWALLMGGGFYAFYILRVFVI